jgi:MFS family permease
MRINTLWRRYQSAYQGLPRAAWILAAVQLVNMCGSMVIFFLTLYLSRVLGFSNDRAGMVMSGYGIGMLGGALVGGALSDRLGAFRVQRIVLATTGAILCGLPFLHDYYWILIGVVLWGFFSCALWPANAAAMSDLCSAEVRPKGFVLNRMANNLGATIGPVVGGFLAVRDYRLLFWVDGGTCLLSAIAMVWCFPRAHVKAHPVETIPKSRYGWTQDRIFLGLLVASVGVGMVFAQVFSTFGMYLKLHQGLSEPWIGKLIAVNTFLIVALQMPLTHRMGRYSGVLVAAAGALLLGLGFGLIPIGSGILFLAFTVVLWTFGEMLLMPSLTMLISLRAPAGSAGHYMGLHSLGFSAGVTLGPIWGMALLQYHRGAALWILVAIDSLLVAIFFWCMSWRWDGKPP